MFVPTLPTWYPPNVSVQRLEATLAALPSGATPAVIERNSALIRELGDPRTVCGLLDSLLCDENALQLTAGRSYRHVNHFDKIVLVDSGDRLGYRLTLHLWWPPYTDKEINDELIHDHRFSFWSSVLVGDLSSQNFTMSGTGQTYRQYRYSPEKRAESTEANFYEFVGDAQLVTAAPSNETAGGAYYLSYDRIHRVVLPRTGMTCTLVLRGPRQRSFSSVFNTSYPTHDTRATNVMFTGAQLRRRLAGLLDELHRARPGS